MTLEPSKNNLNEIATKLRLMSVEATKASKSGHPTSCSSMAEILSCLFFDEMSFFCKQPLHPLNDRFVLSKGHAAPILYAAFAETGLFPHEDLLNLRKIDSDLEGHPTPRLNFIDVATGSLGQGLSVAVGMAYCGKFIDKLPYRVYCLMGDGESFEGSIWEAMGLAAKYRLDNLVGIIDLNRLGQSEATMYGHNTEVYQKKGEAFGWHSIVVNGHDVEEIRKGFLCARETNGKPTLIIAKTEKGYQFPGISDQDNWHGKPLIGDDADRIMTGLRHNISSKVMTTLPIVKAPKEMNHEKTDCHLIINYKEPINYNKDKPVATREAYGNGLLRLGKSCKRVIGLDADTKNSTFSIKLKKELPEQFIECFIGEQNMAGVGIGLACRNRCIPFCSTFSAFLTRAFDQIRMGAVSQTSCNYCGSHCGVSIGEDGPSQMALEDLAMFRTIPNCTVFYPSDAVSCENAVLLGANSENISYIRTSRPATAILYENNEKFEIGKCKIIQSSANDKVTVISSGVTLHEAIKASKTLKEKHNISITIIDLFTIKPIDGETLADRVKLTKGNVLTVEDHYPEGGIGEAVRSALDEHLTDTKINFKSLAVRDIPRSGKCDELLKIFNINHEAIVEGVLAMP